MKKSLRHFISTEVAGGIVLLVAAMLAMIMANSPLAAGYAQLNHLLHLPVNDGLMVIFFFVVGLEIRREMTSGSLKERSAAVLPVAAALAGMAAPALAYFLFNHHTPENLRGWAIPTATDIAFALGILSLLSGRVPAALKALLLAIAIIDDLGAILIIAFFYTENLSGPMLGCALATTAALCALRHYKARPLPPYIALSLLLWVFILNSGVHATIAGVIAAFCMPGGSVDKLEKKLHGFVAFAIMPLFAFINAGVSLEGLSGGILFSPLPLGIALGLFLGKQAGIFGGIYLCVKTGLAQLPRSIGWGHVYGLSLLCGVGFTMSLFIGMLAFHDAAQLSAVRIGVLGGSLLSALGGYAFLRYYRK